MGNPLREPLLPPPSTDQAQDFSGDYFVGDTPPISGVVHFFKAFDKEGRKLWYLAAPAILTSISQYSLGAVTQTFAGHVGTLELAAFSIENCVIAGLSYGVMMGMGSALETLCGQAYGAGDVEMLGVYMQRSWIILLFTAFALMFLYIFATPFLLLIRQDGEISRAAGTYAIWMIPQLFAYAFNFPIAKFLQSQSKVMVMASISIVGLLIHVFLSWLLMVKLQFGMAGGAAVLNFSWWFIVVGQLMYIFSGSCTRSWNGFSWKAFHHLWGFVRLSVASAVMICLEIWYFMALILFAGYLKDAQVAVDGLSICTNILGLTMTVAMGFNAAVSVRVSNELGARHPRAAKLSVFVVVAWSFLVGIAVSMLLFAFHDYPSLFSDDNDVIQVVHRLTPLLAFCIIVNNIQPAISGVAIGGGWQALVAYVNVACYYLFGVPLGLALGYALKLGINGIWYGMVCGTLLQTLILVCIVCRTNWEKEAFMAELRIKAWAGEKSKSDRPTLE